MSDWISVNDRLPKEGQVVLVLYGECKTNITVACYGQDTGWQWYLSDPGIYCYYKIQSPVTHWQPLPEPPEEEERE